MLCGKACVHMVAHCVVIGALTLLTQLMTRLFPLVNRLNSASDKGVPCRSTGLRNACQVLTAKVRNLRVVIRHQYYKVEILYSSKSEKWLIEQQTVILNDVGI